MIVTACGSDLPLALVISGGLLAAVSGIPSLFLGRSSTTAQKWAAVLLLAGSLIGLAGSFLDITTEQSISLTWAWGLPFGPCEFVLDPLAAFFLLPVFLVTSCCAIYGLDYWPASHHPRTFRRLTFFFGLLAAAMTFLVLAHNGILFLICWEIMAIAAFFVLCTEDRNSEVREAGLTYLVATHAGTLALFGFFALLRYATGSFQFPAAASLDGSTMLAAAVFGTALFGFGMKAGLMPLHVWLPSAHASAPSHVSALMSGVMIKMGIYGLVRGFSFFTHVPLWWGMVILAVGIVSGVLGVAFAIGQHDLKRLLAYHSIENIGIIAIGLGLALIGQASGAPLLTVLGLAGALLHVLNHAIFKSLLFLGAGSVIHATGTREIDLMGGLAARLPFSAALFLTGAVAICGLPPLNGFVSEYLIYLGLFSGLRDASGSALPFMALAVPSLALIGGLALACFVKVYGVAFLGAPRSAPAAEGHEAGRFMLSPMALLALLCLLIGLFPKSAAQLLQPAIHTWNPSLSLSGTTLASSAPLGWITLLGLGLLLLTGLLAHALYRRFKAAPTGETVTWDCGYLRPAPRMQYTSSSFAEMLVGLFATALRPHQERPTLKMLFPGTARLTSHLPEAVLELAILPFFAAVNSRFALIRRLQHGQLHLYILYIFATLMVLLICAASFA